MPTESDRDPFAALDTDPYARAIADDLNLREAVIDGLISVRKEVRLNQTVVAERMGVGQSTVSEFENEATDPRLSTLQRYARAVGASLVVSVRPDRTSQNRHVRNRAWSNSKQTDKPVTRPPEYVFRGADVIHAPFGSIRKSATSTAGVRVSA